MVIDLKDFEELCRGNAGRGRVTEKRLVNYTTSKYLQVDCNRASKEGTANVVVSYIMRFVIGYTSTPIE